MKQERKKGLNYSGWRSTTFTMLIALMGFASVAGATYSIPASRSVTWQGNVGVKGDIPSRTTIYKTLSPTGGDDTSAIKTAIANCPTGQVVKLDAGTFNVSSAITVKSGITLRGSGMGKTIIKGKAGTTGTYLVGMKSSSYSLSTSIALSSGLTKGSTTITTATAHNWIVGDIILIDQLNNAQDDPPVNSTGKSACTWCGRSSGTRSMGQLVKIVAVPSSTSATLELPLYWDYDRTLTPQGTKLNGVTRDAGIEDLTIDNMLSASSSQGSSGGTIVLTGNSNCWLLRVEAIGSYQTMVRIYASYRDTIRSSKLHGVGPLDGSQYGSGRGYGLWLNPSASANLIENNQLYDITAAFLINGAVSGNVISYNYVTRLNGTPNNWNRGIIVFHGAHPTMNLVEGNYSDGRLVADDVWGSSSHNTFFRNRHFLTPGLTGGTWDIDLQKNQQYYNIVGNVLGLSGAENYFELNNMAITMASGQKSVFRFGYTSDGDSDASGNDSRVYYTVLRHGNWNGYNSATIWNGADDRVLPPSLYLSEKPSWWGSLQWPAIGPDVTPMYPSALPVGSGTPWNNGQPQLSPPYLMSAQ